MNLRRISLLILVLFGNLLLAQAQTADPGSERDQRMHWWRDARFGMFIHWGLYAIPAGAWGGQTNYGEWIRNNAHIPLDVYDTLVQHFNPVAFDAEAWVRMAKDAGMKYIVLTSKHHDGFALFDSKVSDYDVMATPFGRDIVAELAAECRKQGIVFCLYHSIMDWHHPDYLPRRVWEMDRPVEGADYDRYVDYMKGQLKELLTNYGPLGVLWFDGEWESTWTEERGRDLYAYVRSLQPGILVNNRVGAGRQGMEGMTVDGRFGGDFGTPEQEVPATGLPGVDWESCMTMNDNWGFNAADKKFKSTKELLRTLIDIASKGGNYLLNVGPRADGTFPEESVDRLRGIGGWMKVNGESIYGTVASPFATLPWGRSTQRQTASGVTVYLHVFEWPSDGRLVIPGLMSVPRHAYILGDNDRRAIALSRREDALVVDVPRLPISTVATVVALEFDGTPAIYRAPDVVSDLTIFIDTLSVGVRAFHDQVVVRYTLDGSIPGVSSPAVSDRILLTESANISVRSFAEDRPVSPTSTAAFRKVEPRPTMEAAGSSPGLSYSYYEGEWDSLPDFRRLVARKRGVVRDFTFEPRDQEERFGFVYEGYVDIPATGVYSFSTSSDDGSRLWIGDVMVVENDGLHPMMERSGAVALARGLHPIRVEFFERTGGDGLQVFLKMPGGEKINIPDSILFVEPANR